MDFIQSNLPIFKIETHGTEILDDPRIEARLGIIDNGMGNLNRISDPLNGYNGKISIEIRGSTSQDYPKKQYGFETQNEDGSNNNVSLLGMPGENDWILAAPYSDKTLIRNILASKMSESLGHYAPRMKLCELMLNGDYMGVYVLTEKIKRDANRVNISALNPDEVEGDDLTGGYLLKIDKSTGSDGFWWETSSANIRIQCEYPKMDHIAIEQKNYIIHYMDAFEEALFSAEFTDTLQGYRQFVDLHTFFDYFIVNEISKNIDAYHLSTFLYKDKDSNGGKLSFGPVWDFNIAFGNAYYQKGYLNTGLIAPGNAWWDRLLQDSIFNTRLIDRWIEVRDGQLSDQRIMDYIDSLVFVLEGPQQRNFQKWEVLGKTVWPNYYVGETYDDEINFLKFWLTNRLSWLDESMLGHYLGELPKLNIKTASYPNPFDTYFTYGFSLESAGHVTLGLYDSRGRLMSQIIQDSHYNQGDHQVHWVESGSGHPVPNGLYFIILEVNHQVISRTKVIKIQ